MNKRIEALMEQAMELVDPYALEGEFGPRRLNEEKFAELIVKECVSVVEKRFMGDLNREDMEVRRCVADLKEHFGVKE